MKQCFFCGKQLKRRHQFKYCSNKCQINKQYRFYVTQWLLGIVKGDRGVKTKNISGYIRRYLIEKYGEECSVCHWKVQHPLGGHVPLEIDHINGNSDDNTEANLRLLCPNCHSLTSNFKNRNKGKGREWRKNKYVKN